MNQLTQIQLKVGKRLHLCALFACFFSDGPHNRIKPTIYSQSYCYRGPSGSVLGDDGPLSRVFGQGWDDDERLDAILLDHYLVCVVVHHLLSWEEKENTDINAEEATGKRQCMKTREELGRNWGGPSPTVVEPVCVRHGSTNDLQVKPGSLALGTSD